MATIKLPAKLESLEPATQFIIEAAKSLGFDDKKLNQIRLVSEEVLVNIFNYSYPKKDGEVEITHTTKEEKGLEVKIVDWGIAFNPLEQSAPDLREPIEEREIGGLGIYLIRSIVDEIDYKREENRNIFTFVKY